MKMKAFQRSNTNTFLLLQALLYFWYHIAQCQSFIITNHIKPYDKLLVQRLQKKYPSSSSSSSSQLRLSLTNEAEELRRKAEALKAEIKSFEEAKEKELTKVQVEKQDIAKEKLNLSLRYSAEVPILKGDGNEVMERVYFKSSFGDSINSGKSEIVAYQASLPLGMILSEHESIPGAIEITEISPDSNADLAGIKEGSLLRAVTACQMTMERPTWQLVMGGIGQPKTTRMMYSTDYRPFEEVMEAIASNRMDSMDRDVWIVLEVKNDAAYEL